MAWQTFKLPEIPAEVTSTVDGIKTLTTAATTGLTAIKTLVEALSATATTSLSASQQTIATSVAAIQSAVQSLTNDTGLYFLLVPPRRKVLIPDAVKAALKNAFKTFPTPEGLNVQAMFADKTTTKEEKKILDEMFTATGGNAGFVRTVLDSLDDAEDASRPQLSSTDAVAGMYIVAGAADIASLFPFTNGMSSLVSPGQPTALDVPEIPCPQNLKAKIVAGGAVQLQWTPQQETSELPTLNTFHKITEVAIIRSTSIQFLSATTPKEVFKTSALTKGLKSSDNLTEVIDVIPHSYLSKYTTATTHEPGSYYYATSFHVKLGSSEELESDSGSDLAFPRLSNMAKIYFPKQRPATPRSVTGTPPDWLRSPRTVDFFPALGWLLDKVNAFATQLGETTTGFGDLLQANVKAIDQQIKVYTDLAAQLTSAVDALTAYASIDLGAVSLRLFAGTGGTAFLKQDLVQAFGDSSDPNRPPFDGDEFVSGIVAIATTTDAITLLNKIIGSVTTGISAIEDAIAKIDVELSTIEASVFNADMSPQARSFIAGATTSSTSSTSSTSNLTSLVGEEETTYCYQSYTSDVEFDDNMNPI